MIWLGAAVIIILLGGIVLFGAPYVPSHRRDVEQAFDELYQLSAADTLVDFGSGDGTVLRAAARHGARAVGYELNIILIGVAWLLARRQRQLVTTHMRNYLTAPLPPDTTIVYAFSTGRHIDALVRRVEQEASHLGRPLYLMSYGFKLPGRKLAGSTSVHYLYKLEPLHNSGATV